MRSSETFEPEPATVAGARQFVSSVLQEWGLPAGDVPLLVSELATNAVLHARSEFSVTVWAMRRHVRVEVTDGNSRVPVVSAVPLDAHSGRGLLLLQSLASAWGVDRTNDTGKTIWFEVPVPEVAVSAIPAV